LPHAGHLESVLVVLFAALISVPLVQRLRVTPVIGYLLAGVAIGPHVLGLIKETHNVEILAEFGVLFLLFTIGLDLPFRRLRAMRTYIFGLGMGQVLISSAAIGGLAYLAGIPAQAALVIGGALALSSTATVLQLLVERREVTDAHGRIAVAILLFQDLAVVPLLALLPILASDSTNIGAALALAGVKAAVAIGLIVIVGRVVLRPIYRVMAATRTPEIFAATNLFLVLFTGWATAQAGMSMALGAFLAGLLLADSEYRHQVEADIQPFRGLFLGLFFMTVGMGIDLGRVADGAVMVVGLTVALLVGKAAILLGIMRAFGHANRRAGHVALLLAQGGEFAFVILGLAMQLDVVGQDIAQTLLPAVAISMALTPAFAWLGRTLEGNEPSPAGQALSLDEEKVELSDHVLVAGFGRVGWTVCQVLARNDVPYVAIDTNPQRVQRGRAAGMPVYYGDAGRLPVLEAAGLARARAVVITLDQPGIAERAVATVRAHDPKVPVVSRARDGRHRKNLEESGATSVVSEAVEASLQLGARVLRLAGAPGEKIETTLEAFRRNDYALLDTLLADDDQSSQGEEPAIPAQPGAAETNGLARRVFPRRKSRRTGTE
jgi:CPA2 family monovalent cation:H+ antiporter-2